MHLIFCTFNKKVILGPRDWSVCCLFSHLTSWALRISRIYHLKVRPTDGQTYRERFKRKTEAVDSSINLIPDTLARYGLLHHSIQHYGQYFDQKSQKKHTYYTHPLCLPMALSYNVVDLRPMIWGCKGSAICRWSKSCSWWLCCRYDPEFIFYKYRLFRLMLIVIYVVFICWFLGFWWQSMLCGNAGQHRAGNWFYMRAMFANSL